MAYNQEDILEQDNEVECMNVLDDSDVDDITEEMKLTRDTESDEYR
jgi:hypothetical protein